MASTKIKILCIYDILKKYSDSEHKLSAEDIVKILKSEYGILAERKGIYRDVDVLITHGEDIHKTSGGYYLDKRVFRQAEIGLLVAAVQSASFITPTKTAKLIDALTGNLSMYQKQQMVKQRNMGSVKYANEEIYKNIEAINYAISQRRKISFYYYKKNVLKQDVPQHGGLRYIVSPYAMIWYQDKLYLVCNTDGHDGMTHFRIDRIRGIYCEKIPWRHFSEVSDYKVVFDASRYAAACVNMFGGDIIPVTLRCKNERINEILERFGTSTPIQRGTDGYFTTIVDVAFSEGFMAWLAQYFDGIEIVSPPFARQQMKEHMEAAAKVYGK